jgi:hypothetical protein
MAYRSLKSIVHRTHRLNMELDIQNYLGSCVQLYSLAETPQIPPSNPPAFGLIKRGCYWSVKIDDISL